MHRKRAPRTPGLPPIESLSGFDWTTTTQLKFRPFKPKYHLTMALENLDPSDWIPMDKTYKDRLKLRASLLEKHHDVVLGINNESDPRVRAAVVELYMFLLGTYLPGRYPRMFTLRDKSSSATLENLVTGEVFPVDESVSTITALESLARVADEDFLILLPDITTAAAAGEEEKYILEAYETCFPAGFDTRTKLGLRLASIHDPVPHYTDKLEKSMDRFFAKLPVGRYVKRVNWGITTEPDLFAAFGGIHASEEEEEEEKPIRSEDLDLDKTYLRCERQTLHRLPTSKALVFAYHTYMYPLQEIKDEGLGEDLAMAIDGLKEGSAPGIHMYKRGAVWGEAVKTCLRA
ncbi:hypothetical protein ASPZODRAFT_57148 [Penicilliopsis zonata CBS 506.65]|uniref:Uncharacterized protein n=1 Tax=Penicilliopsis zonata CBS 506.65 TaxID=1073090 RepID=A0A1L9SWH2_9EURO|nr:hypothetical protein ASPZODRAFT_57148 [Penicilliopsis zonata CBS 506.65]OJJ51552.1 hypothetical protein ASPZODRAFT_57148 [Penicilliopsis zonata CBS 506.65]